MNTVALGLVAGALTTFASLPQIVYAIRTRSMDDISLATLGMFGFGVLLWFSYGVEIRSTPIVLWNGLSLLLYLIQIGLKLALTEPGASLLAQLRQMPARNSLL